MGGDMGSEDTIAGRRDLCERQDGQVMFNEQRKIGVPTSKCSVRLRRPEICDVGDKTMKFQIILLTIFALPASIFGATNSNDYVDALTEKANKPGLFSDYKNSDWIGVSLESGPHPETGENVWKGHFISRERYDKLPGYTPFKDKVPLGFDEALLIVLQNLPEGKTETDYNVSRVSLQNTFSDFPNSKPIWFYRISLRPKDMRAYAQNKQQALDFLILFDGKIVMPRLEEFQ